MSDAIANAWARKIAEAAARIARDSIGQQVVREEAYVTGVGSDGTLTLNRGSASHPQTLRGIRMTTACDGVRTGDRVLLETVSGVSYAVGVIATGRNLPRPGSKARSFARDGAPDAWAHVGDVLLDGGASALVTAWVTGTSDSGERRAMAEVSVSSDGSDRAVSARLTWCTSSEIDVRTVEGDGGYVEVWLGLASWGEWECSCEVSGDYAAWRHAGESAQDAPDKAKPAPTLGVVPSASDWDALSAVRVVDVKWESGIGTNYGQLDVMQVGKTVFLSGYYQTTQAQWVDRTIVTGLPKAACNMRSPVGVQRSEGPGAAFVQVFKGSTSCKLFTKYLPIDDEWVFFGLSYPTE